MREIALLTAAIAIDARSKFKRTYLPNRAAAVAVVLAIVTPRTRERNDDYDGGFCNEKEREPGKQGASPMVLNSTRFRFFEMTEKS